MFFLPSYRACEGQLTSKDDRVLVSSSEGGQVEKEKKKEQNEKQRQTKKEQREREIKIMKLRAHYAECKLKKEEGKGDAQWMTWKGKEIGRYTGPGLLGPTLVKLRKNQFNWELIFRLTEKAAPYKTFKLYEGLSNTYAYGEIDLEARNFICHVKDHHHGVVPKGSQINRPPWFDFIFFGDDELEELFCFTEEENLD